VLWHKERLLNLALEELPDHCEYVAWLDADVLFEDDDWVERSISQLRKHSVIQPFENAIRLPRGKGPERYPGRRIGWRIRKGSQSGTYTPSFCSRYSGAKPRFGGATGYAWCARRELLDRHGFYDRCILGGADRELAFAFSVEPGRVPDQELRIRAAKLRRHFARWRDAVYADVRGDISFIDGTIHHLWHGETTHRRYEQRHRIIEQHGFDPAEDLELDDNGCWRFAPGAQALARDVEGYLSSRREDG
jgi:hypothetical protein